MASFYWNSLIMLVFLVAFTTLVWRSSAQKHENEANACTDTKDAEDCNFMYKNGWCEEDMKYLQRKCDLTCGWCSESDDCVDKAAYLDCEGITQQECNSNPELYSTRCKKSCGWCKGLPTGAWKTWSSWTECSATCDPGFRIRHRRCLTSNCQGKSSEVDVCLVKLCAIWSPWSLWGDCSVSCGRGLKRRSRSCPQENQCPGISEEVTSCQQLLCVVAKWSECSRTCGGGTRMKVSPCNKPDPNLCLKIYEDCNTQRCPYKSCSSYRYGLDKTACCNDKEDNCVRASKRLIGGMISKPKQFAWMARIEIVGVIRMRNISRLLCGGTLVHPEYVVTAAHCLESVTRHQLRVVLGAISKFDTSTRVQRKLVSNFTMHPNYSEPTNDLAIIKLNSPAAMTGFVAILSLPEGEETALDIKCFVAGWGKTNFELTVGFPNLLEAKVRHLPFDICAIGHSTSIYGQFMDSKTMMCAGIIVGGTDTCEGDSGGPLMCQRCSSCSWYLAGVTSFGAIECGVANVPGVYTRVLYYEDWINAFIAE